MDLAGKLAVYRRELALKEAAGDEEGASIERRLIARLEEKEGKKK